MRNVLMWKAKRKTFGALAKHKLWKWWKVFPNGFKIKIFFIYFFKPLSLFRTYSTSSRSIEILFWAWFMPRHISHLLCIARYLQRHFSSANSFPSPFVMFMPHVSHFSSLRTFSTRKNLQLSIGCDMFFVDVQKKKFLCEFELKRAMFLGEKTKQKVKFNFFSAGKSKANRNGGKYLIGNSLLSFMGNPSRLQMDVNDLVAVFFP